MFLWCTWCFLWCINSLEVYCPRDADTQTYTSKLQQFALGERQEVDVVWKQGRKIRSSFWLHVCTAGQFPQHTSQAPSTHTHARSGCAAFQKVSGVQGHDFNGNGWRGHSFPQTKLNERTHKHTQTYRMHEVCQWDGDQRVKWLTNEKTFDLVQWVINSWSDYVNTSKEQITKLELIVSN